MSAQSGPRSTARIVDTHALPNENSHTVGETRIYHTYVDDTLDVDLKLRDTTIWTKHLTSSW